LEYWDDEVSDKRGWGELGGSAQAPRAVFGGAHYAAPGTQPSGCRNSHRPIADLSLVTRHSPLEIPMRRKTVDRSGVSGFQSKPIFVCFVFFAYFVVKIPHETFHSFQPRYSAISRDITGYFTQKIKSIKPLIFRGILNVSPIPFHLCGITLQNSRQYRVASQNTVANLPFA
jgi:hypothetical protein